MPTTDFCSDCSSVLERRFFETGGRVATKKGGVPLFKGHNLADEKAGMTPPPAIVCPRCDTPDPGLDMDTLGGLLQHAYTQILMESTDQIESD